MPAQFGQHQSAELRLKFRETANRRVPLAENPSLPLSKVAPPSGCSSYTHFGISQTLSSIVDHRLTRFSLARRRRIQ
jgi:hypothetical protein